MRVLGADIMRNAEVYGFDCMQCTSPRHISVLMKDGARKEFWVPCGKCAACRIAKKREWTVRLLHEASQYEENCFVTLTYSEDYLPADGSLSKRALQLFFKRLRKNLSLEGRGRIRYFACGEYGDRFGRPHYHAIIFGAGSDIRDIVQESWPFGFIQIAPVTIYRLQYVAGYVQKKLDGLPAEERYGDKQPPFSLQSQGLGKAYALENRDKLLRDLSCKTWRGDRFGLPKYYRKVLDPLGDPEITERLASASYDEKLSVLRRHGIHVPDGREGDREYIDLIYDLATYSSDWGRVKSILESRRIADKTLRQKLNLELQRRHKK